MRFASSRPIVREIKATLLEFHKNMGYRIFDSFPLVSADPTVMFVNATITPFKSWFADSSIHPDNYALIQGCLRMGGASELDVVGTNPYYFTFFEMFGSGTFRITHEEAISYLMELLATFGLGKQNLYFIIPTESGFREALKRNGIEEGWVFQLSENSYFWQEWKFGVPGPVGHGLTVVFSRSSEKAESVEQLANDRDRYIELLNLIYIHSQSTSEGKLMPIPNPGFDLGVGIERLAAVLQNCDSYHIDNILPLVETVRKFLSAHSEKSDEIVTRICSDHFRAIYALSAQGLTPSNKGHGYVLRKLIRRFLETIWSSIGRPESTRELIRCLSEVLEGQGNEISVRGRIDITDKVLDEEKALLNIVQNAQQIIRKHPEASPQMLYDTYGISRTILTLAQQNQHQKKGGKT